MDPNEKKYLASSHKGLLELCKKRGIPTTRVGKRGCISSKELIELLKEKDKEDSSKEAAVEAVVEVAPVVDAAPVVEETPEAPAAEEKSAE